MSRSTRSRQSGWVVLLDAFPVTMLVFILIIDLFGKIMEVIHVPLMALILFAVCRAPGTSYTARILSSGILRALTPHTYAIYMMHIPVLRWILFIRRFKITNLISGTWGLDLYFEKMGFGWAVENDPFRHTPVRRSLGLTFCEVAFPFLAKCCCPYLQRQLDYNQRNSSRKTLASSVSTTRFRSTIGRTCRLKECTRAALVLRGGNIHLSLLHYIRCPRIALHTRAVWSILQQVLPIPRQAKEGARKGRVDV